MLNIKYNMIANYLGQAYKAGIGIVMMPIYLSLLGSESFGLIGFYIMIQSWLQLLDLGLKPTLMRESSKYLSGSISVVNLKISLRTMELIFSVVSIFVIFLSFYYSDYISSDWLQISSLDLYVVSNAIFLIGIIVAIRWISSLYQGVLSGLEKQIWLNIVNIIFATFRFVGVLIPLVVIEKSIVIFFIYQVIVTILEFIVLVFYLYNFLDSKDKGHFSLSRLKKLFKFSVPVAAGSIVWVLVSQIDKLILSKQLPLDLYGAFSLSVVIANGVFILSNAVGQAVMPRLTIYSVNNDNKSFLKLYKFTLEVILLTIIPIASTLIVLDDSILLLLIKDPSTSRVSSEYFYWYVLGNVMVSLSAFSYYLQYSVGRLKAHLVVNIIYAVFFVPVQFFVSTNYGPEGAGIVWFSFNCVMAIFWVGYVNNLFFDKINMYWFFTIFKYIFISFLSAKSISYLMPLSEFPSEFNVIFSTILTYLFTLLIVLVFSKYFRMYFFERWLCVKKK